MRPTRWRAARQLNRGAWQDSWNDVQGWSGRVTHDGPFQMVGQEAPPFRYLEGMEEDRRSEKAKYEYPVRGLNWTAGVGQPAGIYWLEGRSLIAGHNSAAEDYLLRMGAI